jgi:hypothetical protein
MVVSGSTALIFGGYDGTAATNQILQIDLQPVQQLQRSSLQDLINSMACCGSGGICGGSFTDSVLGSSRKSSKTDQMLLGGAGKSVSTDGGVSTEGDLNGSADGSMLKAVGVVPRAAGLPPVVKALSKKAAPPPLKLSDLPYAEEVARMPQWKQVRQLHQVSLNMIFIVILFVVIVSIDLLLLSFIILLLFYLWVCYYCCNVFIA